MRVFSFLTCTLLFAAACGVSAAEPGKKSASGASTAEKAVNYAERLKEPVLLNVEPQVIISTKGSTASEKGVRKYSWRTNIVTTTFWVGELAAKNNPVPNIKSSWDQNWTRNYGGYDNPDRKKRNGYLPAAFIPQQNPFYIALPYNDMTMKGYKPEASRVIPWFNDVQPRNGQSVLKGRWVAIRYKGRVAYAQWEDCGPFRTDHWQYVFGNERPKPNLNRGAGLDVSPAVRDYLGMNDTDVTDWKFVEFEDVPHGPWAIHGKNNTFVQRAQERQSRLVDSGVGSATIRVQ
jgi:hypothetical protein